MEIEETTYGPQRVLAVRKTILAKNVSDSSLWEAAFGAVYGFIGQNGLTPAGPATAVFLSWDPDGEADIAIGSPISGEVADSGELSVVEVPASRAYKVTVRGDYENLREGHGALMQYCQEHNVETGLAVEEYVVTGEQDPNPANWETNVYHLIAD